MVRKHRTNEETAAILQRMLALQGEERDHFAAVISMLSECYGDEKHSSAVILINTPNDMLRVTSANANELDVAEMINNAAVMMNSLVMEDAPPKELFN